jgi:D-alanyl-D-alanine carboxypeptidase (penicillin-binding protein 5/6)
MLRPPSPHPVTRFVRWQAGIAVLAVALTFTPAAEAQQGAARSTANAAQVQSGEFQVKARNAALIDADSGALMFQHNADELAPPASMSKLMTLAVLYRAMKDGKVKPDDEFLVSEYAWRTGGGPSGTSAMFVPINTRARVDELIKGIVVQSGNDAAIAVGEALAGSESAFAKMMTDEARKIGLTKSSFRNATGLHHPEHLMSARELALLARHIIKTYPEQYAVYGQKEFNYRKHRFINRNPLLFQSAGVDGLKTGYTKEAGFGIVASAKQGERRLIAVINGAATADDRRDEARRLLEWGFRAFGEFKLFEENETVARARVWGGERFSVGLVGNGPVVVVLPKFPANQRLRAEVIYSGPLKTPIAKGDQVARLRVISSTEATAEVPLYAAEDVSPGSTWRRGLDSLLNYATRWIP